MTKIYIVYEHYNNGVPYDAEYKYSVIYKVYATREMAEAYIASLQVPEGYIEGFKENENVWDENQGIRWFHEDVNNDAMGLYWYSIESYKVEGKEEEEEV